MQCETVQGGLQGNKLIVATAKKMLQGDGVRAYYRGLFMGLGGMFPYSAIDLTTYGRTYPDFLLSQLALKHSDMACLCLRIPETMANSTKYADPQVFRTRCITGRYDDRWDRSHQQFFWS